MRVDRLVVTGFRSYEQLVIDPPPGPQILYGANAAGKTNLVESLVVLARGASHRAADTELVAWSGELARLEAAVDHGPGHGPDLVEVVIPRPTAGHGRPQAHPDQRRAAPRPGARPGAPGRALRPRGDAPRGGLAGPPARCP